MNQTDDAVAVVSGWDATWVQNSMGVYIYVGSFTKCLYFIIVVCICIITHSFYIGGFTYKKVRVCAEVAAWSTILQAICYLSCTNYDSDDYLTGNACNVRESAYTMVFFCIGILGAINQICDNFMVFNLYLIITDNVSTLHKLSTLSFVVIFLYMSWLPFYTFLPLIVDINSVTALYWVYVCQTFILMISYIMYDFLYISLILLRFIQLIKNTEKISSRKSFLKILAIKAIIHNLISAGSIVGYIYWVPYGIIWYNLCTTISLHCCFNYKVENMFKKRRNDNVSKASGAELLSMKPLSLSSLFLNRKPKMFPASNPSLYEKPSVSKRESAGVMKVKSSQRNNEISIRRNNERSLQRHVERSSLRVNYERLEPTGNNEVSHRDISVIQPLDDDSIFRTVLAQGF